jgi:hypothetical protein
MIGQDQATKIREPAVAVDRRDAVLRDDVVGVMTG